MSESPCPYSITGHGYGRSSITGKTVCVYCGKELN